MEKGSFFINQNISILEALKALDNLRDTSMTLFVLNEEQQMVGTLTDGDIRRALLFNTPLSSPVELAMNKKFFRLSPSDNNVYGIQKCRQLGLALIPVLNDEGEIVAIHNLKEKKSILPIDAVLMAGGKGERLRPLTEKTPKPLLPVGGKAIIDYNVERLLSYGIEHISVTVNYLKEQIEEHFKESRQGVQIQTVREPQFMGTIGSVKYISHFHNDTVLIMNSDLFTNINYEDFYLHFLENKADMSVAAVPYTISVPYGVFELNGRDVCGLKEKPVYNHYVNAGIYLVKKELLSFIPDDTFFNATDFINTLLALKKNIIRFPITGYWLDIGKHEEYMKAQELAKHL